MSDLDILKGRIDRAVQQLSDVQATRRQSNDTLTGLLSDLEAKYRARDEELGYCSQRIVGLESDNRELFHLVEQLVGIMETWAGQGNEDPVFDAAALASNLLDDWQPTAGGEAPESAPDDAGEPVQEVVPEHEPDHEPAPELPMAFQDVEPQALAAELTEEIIEPELPEPLIEAIDQAAGSAVARGETEALEDPPAGEAVLEDRTAAEAELIAAAEDDSAFLAEDPVPMTMADDPAREIGAPDQPPGAEAPVEPEDFVILDETAIEAAIEDEDIVILDETAIEAGIEAEDEDHRDISPEDFADMLIHDMTEPVDIEIPDIEDAFEPPAPLPAAVEDPEASIRAMMARLEQAADRARTALEPDSAEDPAQDDPVASATPSG